MILWDIYKVQFTYILQQHQFLFRPDFIDDFYKESKFLNYLNSDRP